MRYHRRWRKDKDVWMMVIAGIAILSGVFAMIGQKQQDTTLPVYQETDQVSTENRTSSSEAPLKTDVYNDDKAGFSLLVPADWTRVTKSGYPTFIQKETGASVSIETRDYDPTVNTADESSLSAAAAQAGYTMVGFTKPSGSHYEVLYQGTSGGETYDYIEEVYWTASHTVMLYGTLPDAAYADVHPYFEKMVSSFAWSADDAIPNGYHISYLSDAGFQIGIPDNWTEAVSGSSYVAQDSQSTAALTLSMSESGQYLDSMTATDMVQLVRGSRESFLFGSFETSHTLAHSISTYIENNVQYTDNCYLSSDGQYLYLIDFTYEKGTIADSLPETCLSLFRSFHTTDTSTVDSVESSGMLAAQEGIQNGTNQAASSGTTSGPADDAAFQNQAASAAQYPSAYGRSPMDVLNGSSGANSGG